MCRNEGYEDLSEGTMPGLRASQVGVLAVKDLLRNHPGWKADLNRAAFSDNRIAEAIAASFEIQRRAF